MTHPQREENRTDTLSKAKKLVLEKRREKSILGGAESYTDTQLQAWHTSAHK